MTHGDGGREQGTLGQVVRINCAAQAARLQTPSAGRDELSEVSSKQRGGGFPRKTLISGVSYMSGRSQAGSQA